MSEVELSRRECQELLGSDMVGRVAFVTPEGPRIVPVNYAMSEDALEFRTTAYSEFGVYAPGHRIAFEIDHLDVERRRGWSVVAHGVCSRVELAHPTDGPVPWAGGHRSLLLRLEWDELTGRRVGGEHWPHPAVSDRGRPS